MNIPWDKIIEAVIQLVTMCLAQGMDRAAVKARLMNATPFDWLRLRRLLRRDGLRGDDLRVALDAARTTPFAADSDFLDELIDQAMAA